MIGWKRDQYEFVDSQEIHHEDLIQRYGENGKFFKRGNVGLLCLLKHRRSCKQVVVVNTHNHWNPKYDFVKYGQAFWLLKNTSLFLTKHGLSLEGENGAALVICGDFNSKPDSSVFHLMCNKEYDLTLDDRSHPIDGIKAYRKAQGRQAFDQVVEDYENNVGPMSNIIGKLSSSYMLFNPANEPMTAQGPDLSLLEWADSMMKSHQLFTMYTDQSHLTIDYIFYNPHVMQVTHLLREPSLEEVTEGASLPSMKFPSDHVRIQSKFLIFH